MKSKPQQDFRMTSEELGELIWPQADQTSQISDFYSNRSVLITGASGFVGKILVEKLLRACDNIGQIFVLIRPKKGKQPDERLRQLISSIVFDGVRHKEVINRLIAIEGDITKPLLGLSEQNLDNLVQNVSVILHSAAAVGFDQSLKAAVESNLIGTYNVIQLGRKLPKLVSMVYVSTAYSNCPLSNHLDEHIYPVNMEPQLLIDMASSLDEELMELIKKPLIGDHPNTYTYTKSLAEWLCGQHSNELPIVICRPSVVVCTWREPLAGYLDNYNAGNGIFTLISRGILMAGLAEYSCHVDSVPVDLVVNCVLASSWFANLYYSHFRKIIEPQSVNYYSDQTQNGEMEKKLRNFYQNVREKVLSKGMPESLATLPVFHIACVAENPISTGHVLAYVVKYATEYPYSKLFRVPNFVMANNKYSYWYFRLIFHVIPAYIITFLGYITGAGFDMVKIVGKIDNIVRTQSYFFLKEWKFNPENRLSLINDFMSNEDRRLFNCDVKSIDWETFCHKYVIGIRKFMLKDPMSNLKEARSRFRKLYWTNTTIQLLFIAAICYFIIAFL